MPDQNYYLDFVETLTWGANSTAIAIKQEYVDYLLDAFNRFSSRQGENSNFLKYYLSLVSPDEHKKLVLYPEVSDILHPRTILLDDSSLAHLAGYAYSHLAILGRISRDLSVFFLFEEYFRHNSNTDGLCVYFSGEIEFPGMPGDPRLFELMEHEKIDQRSKLNRSILLIKSISNDAAWNFVRLGTGLLCFQNETADTEKFGSASFRGFAGLNLILNPRFASSCTLADAVLHEAIHSVLYQIEPIYVDFFQNKTLAKSRVVSPWSGNQITLDNLFQANYVWHGLLSFWRQIRQSSNVSSDVEKYAQGRISFIERGFKNDCYKADLKEALSPFAYQGLCRIWDLHR